MTNRQTPLRGVLFIGAHPDDETVMAGGTLAMLHQRGISTFIACATDGRGGESGGVPEVQTLTDLARLRQRELTCAADALGAASVTLFGYEDPVIGPDETLYGFAADENVFVDQIADLIRLKDVDVVLSHGTDGEYGHPAHIQVNRAVRRAVREHTPDVLFYSIAARVPGVEDRIWNVSDPAHFALDISPWFDAKHAAMICHRTQYELFKRRRKLKTVGEAVRTLESFHRHWPDTSGALPDDAFAALLLAAGASSPPR
ncbi:MAG: PIG-L family deacetylase [Anaerolineae bacterium]|nr:PIG-L family deacetylase [Anaerolineae bacterium]